MSLDGLKNGMSFTACFIIFLKVLSHCNITRNVSETYMPFSVQIQNYYLYVQGMGATPAPSLVLIK